MIVLDALFVIIWIIKTFLQQFAMPPIHARIQFLSVLFVTHFVGEPHIIPLLAVILRRGQRVGLLRISLHLRLRQSTGQLAILLIHGQIKTVFKVVADFVSNVGEQKFGVLLTVCAIAVAVTR